MAGEIKCLSCGASLRQESFSPGENTNRCAVCGTEAGFNTADQAAGPLEQVQNMFAPMGEPGNGLDPAGPTTQTAANTACYAAPGDDLFQTQVPKIARQVLMDLGAEDFQERLAATTKTNQAEAAGKRKFRLSRFFK